MTDTASILAELLADCDAHGIRLLPAGVDELAIDAPHDVLTLELLDRLKAHRARCWRCCRGRRTARQST